MEISLLEPRPLNGLVRKFAGEVSESLLGLTLIGASMPDINPTWEYDILRGNRDRSEPNTPNSEANLIDHMKHGKMTGAYVYLRDKKMFNPTTLRWLRAAGENVVASDNARRMVAAELSDMVLRQQRFQEFTVWQMFQGSLTYTHKGGASVTVDFGISNSHKPSVAVTWGASGDDPIGDIGAVKRLFTRDSGVRATDAYMNDVTWAEFNVLPELRAQLSEEQKRQITSEGFLSRFQGLNWHPYDGGFVENDTFSAYIPDDKIIFLARDNNPYEMKWGPSADDDSPDGHTGPFSKTWKEKDPSNRQVLVELNFMPVLFRPDQVVILDVS